MCLSSEPQLRIAFLTKNNGIADAIRDFVDDEDKFVEDAFNLVRYAFDFVCRVSDDSCHLGCMFVHFWAI